MIKDADLAIALPKLFESFLAMTEVGIVHEGEGEVEWGEFAIVNGRRIDMVCLSPAAWSDPAAVPIGAPNDGTDLPDIPSAAG
jgi:hypothetical protein